MLLRLTALCFFWFLCSLEANGAFHQHFKFWLLVAWLCPHNCSEDCDFEGKAIEAMYSDSQNRPSQAPSAPSAKFYIFLDLFGFGSGAFMLSHPTRGFLELHWGSSCAWFGAHFTCSHGDAGDPLCPWSSHYLLFLCSVSPETLLDSSMPVLELASGACFLSFLQLLAWVSPSPSHEVLGTSLYPDFGGFCPCFLHCNVWMHLEICVLAASYGWPALLHEQASPQPPNVLVCHEIFLLTHPPDPLNCPLQKHTVGWMRSSPSVSCADAFIQASLKLLERRQWRLGHDLCLVWMLRKSPESAEPKSLYLQMLEGRFSWDSVWGRAEFVGQTPFSAAGVWDRNLLFCSALSKSSFL